VLNVDIGTENSMILTGFEILEDADSDDVYNMADLETVQLGMELLDNAANDRDTIKVGDDAVAYDGGPAVLTAAADTISLEVLNDVFGFDFDVLDITNVTENDLIVVADDDNQDNLGLLNAADNDYVGPGDADEDGDLDVARDLNDDVVIGSIDLIDSITGFDNIWLTNASITSAGSVYELDIDADELVSNNVTNLITDSRGLNFSLVTTAVAVSVTDIAQAGAVVVGTALADDITGGAGADTITGGAGADVLDGNIVPEVTETVVATLNGGAASLELGDVIVIAGVTIDDSVAAAGDFSVVAGSDADQVGSAFEVWAAVAANLTTIEGNLGLAAGDLGSVTYDLGSNNIIFNFTSQAGDVAAATVTVNNAGMATGTLAATVFENGLDAATQSADYSAQGESADTFVYEAATDSTAAAMDEISNFTVNAVGPVDDVIDLSALDHTHTGVDNGGSAFANFAAVMAAAQASFDADNDSVFVGSDGTDTWVFHSSDTHVADPAIDLVIKLVGIDATGIDANNVLF